MEPNGTALEAVEKARSQWEKCHGNSEAVIEILHLALLSWKLKMNVGDFRIKKKKIGGDSISGMSKCPLLSAFPSSFREEMWSSGAVHEPPETRLQPGKKNAKKKKDD